MLSFGVADALLMDASPVRPVRNSTSLPNDE
jgi:hypothetical protein